MRRRLSISISPRAGAMLDGIADGEHTVSSYLTQLIEDSESELAAALHALAAAGVRDDDLRSMCERLHQPSVREAVAQLIDHDLDPGHAADVLSVARAYWRLHPVARALGS